MFRFIYHNAEILICRTFSGKSREYEEDNYGVASSSKSYAKKSIKKSRRSQQDPYDSEHEELKKSRSRPDGERTDRRSQQDPRDSEHKDQKRSRRSRPDIESGNNARKRRSQQKRSRRRSRSAGAKRSRPDTGDSESEDYVKRSRHSDKPKIYDKLEDLDKNLKEALRVNEILGFVIYFSLYCYIQIY